LNSIINDRLKLRARDAWSHSSARLDTECQNRMQTKGVLWLRNFQMSERSTSWQQAVHASATNAITRIQPRSATVSVGTTQQMQSHASNRGRPRCLWARRNKCNHTHPTAVGHGVCGHDATHKHPCIHPCMHDESTEPCMHEYHEPDGGVTVRWVEMLKEIERSRSNL
jgi:hypothetical protein